MGSTSLGNLSRLSAAQTHSICAENFTGAKGAGGMAIEGNGATYARDLGRGWKISPSVSIKAGATFIVADIVGSGAIQQVWMTPSGPWRYSILRIYWDGQEQPSVECPLGDFFAMPWGRYAPLVSLPVCVNPGRAFNCYWEMPFRQHCRITLTPCRIRGDNRRPDRTGPACRCNAAHRRIRSWCRQSAGRHAWS
jgi:hypothetical protein